MRVYHIVHEPSFKSAGIHFWTECNLKCRGCFCNYEKLDFSLIDNWADEVSRRNQQSPPTHFLSLEEVLKLLEKLDIERVIFIGTEPSLDPELPALAKELQKRFNSYNILLTNGVRLTDMTHIDEVVFSIKAVSDDIYRVYTGRSNKKTLKNFQTIYNSGKKLQAECLLIPGMIDAEEIEKVARFIASVDKNITLRIDGYFEVGDCPWPAATNEDVARAASLARKHLSKVNYLTGDMELKGEKPVRVF